MVFGIFYRQVLIIFLYKYSKTCRYRQVLNKIKHSLSLIKGLIQKLTKEGISNSSWHKVILSNILIERCEQNKESYPVHSVSVTAGVINQVEYLGRSFAANDTSRYHVVRYGDIIYTKSPTGNQPYGIVKQSHCQEPVAVSPLYGVYKPLSFEIGNYLHYYFLNPLNTNNYLSPLIQKGAKNTINISNQRFLGNKIPIPVDIKEIRTISNTLSAINQKIQTEKSIHTSLVMQKKFLLQKLFI
ncbi:restriction endonuclease subunit S [Lepagella muris]|uniref:Restriction endonuclease subunit S n=1 Tax=Lepagella muris TaxID=3032870 RepID=A0AC61RG35_9BACT|nr:restriction endonuclease subunit S [Lepagella muris]TGY78358.1 restriction endonuclease subunit S [Lepagella muris]TKC57774.1 restriction endonuclease subunit S [Bacteroidales bacterium]